MATNISFSGLGSGIDFNVVRDAIISQRSIPITQLQTKASNYNGRIDSLKQLNGLLATLTTASEALKNRDLGNARNGVTSDATVASASASPTAVLGNFDLNVSRIATKLTQASRNFTSSTDPFLAGGATTATFALTKGGASPGIEITIDSTNNTLEGFRDSINAANAGVTANIVDIKGDGTELQLVLTSNDTGLAGRVELTETTATGTVTDLNIRSLNPPDGDFAKLNSAFTINGLELSRSTNSISDAVTGVNLTLKKVGTSTITITQSTDIENKLRGFINAYNAIQDFVGAQYKKDARDRPVGFLAGDATLRNVQQQLRGALNTIASNNGGALDSFSQIGISASETGQLTFDSVILNEKLKENASDVQALLNGKTASDTGLFQGIHELTKGLSDEATGTVQTAITGYKNSVKSLSDSVNFRLEALGRLRELLTRQFSAADAAIGQLNNQGTALTSIIKSLEPRQT